MGPRGRCLPAGPQPPPRGEPSPPGGTGPRMRASEVGSERRSPVFSPSLLSCLALGRVPAWHHCRGSRVCVCAPSGTSARHAVLPPPAGSLFVWQERCRMDPAKGRGCELHVQRQDAECHSVRPLGGPFHLLTVAFLRGFPWPLAQVCGRRAERCRAGLWASALGLAAGPPTGLTGVPAVPVTLTMSCLSFLASGDGESLVRSVL